jgi:hypothetical protein
MAGSGEHSGTCGAYSGQRSMPVKDLVHRALAHRSTRALHLTTQARETLLVLVLPSSSVSLRSVLAGGRHHPPRCGG